VYFGTKNAILRTRLVRKVWIFNFRPSGLHYCRVIGLFGIWGIKQGFPSTRWHLGVPWGPVRCPCCAYGPCRTPVSGQCAAGEAELRDIGTARCSAAGVAELGALGAFRQHGPGFAARATHSGARPALSAHPGGPS